VFKFQPSEIDSLEMEEFNYWMEKALKVLKDGREMD